MKKLRDYSPEELYYIAASLFHTENVVQDEICEQVRCEEINSFETYTRFIIRRALGIERLEEAEQ